VYWLSLYSSTFFCCGFHCQLGSSARVNENRKHWRGRTVVVVIVEKSSQSRLRLVHDAKMGDRSDALVSARLRYSGKRPKLVRSPVHVQLLVSSTSCRRSRYGCQRTWTRTHMFSNFRRSFSVSVAPSNLAPSKSLQTATTNTNDRSDNSATTEIPLLPNPVTAKDIPSRSRRNVKSVQISVGFWAHWTAFKKRVASGTPPSTSSSPDNSTGTTSCIHKPHGSTPCEQDEHVDVVVVDRVWGEDPKWSTKSDSNPPPEAENKLGTTNTDPGSSEVDAGFWALSPVLFFFRWRIWPPILGFFRLRFVDPKFEAHYAKETWFLRKRLALFSAVFFVINWLVPIILITRPVTLADAIFYYGVGGLGLSHTESNA